MASTFPSSRDDGTPAFVRDLALQEAEDFDVMVLVPRVPGAAAEERLDTLIVRRFAYFPRRWEDLADGAIIENLRARPSRWLQVVPFLFGELRALRRAIRDFRPDVLHVHWIVPQGVVARIGGGRLPRVMTTLGGDLYALRGGLLTRVKGWALRSASSVTVMNAEMGRIVDGLGSRRTVVAPMGADLSVARTVASTRSPGGTGALRLLFVGRLVEKKGLHVLLEALRRVEAPFELTVVGDGPLRADLVARAAGLPVDFVGQLGRTELTAQYGLHDVTVTPSVHARSGDKDGLPVALLEAMGSGCAIIASRLPGIDEAVEHEASGVLVPSDDADALAAAIDRLAGDPELVTRLGATAAEHAERFSVEQAGTVYRGLLQDALRAVEAPPASRRGSR